MFDIRRQGGVERREAVLRDKEWLLLHAEQCKRFAAGCIDRDVAVKFAELARYYQSLAADAETEPQVSDLLRPCDHRAERGGRCSYRECQMSNPGRNLLIAIITAVICGILFYAAIRY